MNTIGRAWQFAEEIKNNPRSDKPPIVNPAVLGAIIDLGVCLDLIDSESLELVKESYRILEMSSQALGMKLPQNKKGKDSVDLLLRNLDCLVIESLHAGNLPFSYDSVRGVFWEGEELYHNAGFKEKNHIQVCIRNPNCIKGYFLPRKLDAAYKKV